MQKSPMRVALFDLETTDLAANAGRIMAAVFKQYDPEETVIFRADDYKDWKRGKRYSDKEIVTDIIEFAADFDILVAYNGVRFDNRWLATKAIKYGIEPLQPKIIDPLRLARKHLKLTSNRLDTVAKYFELPVQKTPLDIEIWIRAAMDGDKACLDQIVEHCVADVEVLDGVMQKLRPFVRQIDQLGSWRS